MTVTIEKLVFGGQGLARLEDGQVIFVWNALPGEEVEIEIIKKKRNYLEGKAVKIIKASPNRVEPTMDYYLSSAPWDMMDYETECKWKVAMAKELFEKVGGVSDLDIEIVAPKEQYGYRNKIEFSFCDKNFVPKDERTEEHIEDISLSFFARGSKSRIPVEECKLATPAINEVAKKILAWVIEEKISNRTLKSLVIRSNKKGEVIAALFIKDHMVFNNSPKLDEQLKGFHIYFSSHKSPASRPDKILHSEGQEFLTEIINGVELQYGLLSFFQVNVPVFEQTLEEIAKFVPKDAKLIDYYTGVGAIGLALAKNCDRVRLIDSNEEAIELANKNIVANKIGNAETHCIAAEKMTAHISTEATIIVDPPRAGLHPDVTGELIDEKPERIIYLSCNLSTQARDIERLSESHKVVFAKLYNYFPRTPHVECLVILDRK